MARRVRRAVGQGGRQAARGRRRRARAPAAAAGGPTRRPPATPPSPEPPGAAVRSAAACATLETPDVPGARHRPGERREGRSGPRPHPCARIAPAPTRSSSCRRGPTSLAFRRELAAGGLVFGVRVETFSGLEPRDRRAHRAPGRRGLARSCGCASPRPAIAADAARRARRVGGDAGVRRGVRRALRGSSPRPGSARGSGTRRVRAWGEAEPAGARTPRSSRRSTAPTATASTKAGGEPATRAYELHDALRLNPGAWGGTPVLFYGFDDFTAPELDAVRTLALIDAPVVVSLPYEDGREDVYRTRSRTLAELLALAGERHVPAPAGRRGGSGARAPRARPADAEPGAGGRPATPSGCSSGGGERAELELIAETARAAIADGMAPEDIAVALRDSDRAAPLVLRVFAEAGVPVALERRVPVAHTTLGRGLLALLAAALPGGTADDLLAWLRVPGRLDRPETADLLERDLRRAGAQDARGAHDAWERLAGFRFGELDDLAALDRDPAAFCELLLARAEELLVRPWRGSGAVLPPESAEDAAALRRVRTALEQLDRGSAAPSRRSRPTCARSARCSARSSSRSARRPGPASSPIADPLRLRARRVRLLLLGRMQEGVFPLPGGRRSVPRGRRAAGHQHRGRPAAAAARGSARRRALAALLGASRGRPSALVLSWHRGDDDGEPRVRSLFVDDVLACFTPALADGVARPPAGRGRLRRAGGGPRQRRLAAAAAAPDLAPEPGLGPAHRRRSRSRRSTPATRGRRARSSSGSRARCAGSSSGCSGPSSWIPTPRR